MACPFGDSRGQTGSRRCWTERVSHRYTRFVILLPPQVPVCPPPIHDRHTPGHGINTGRYTRDTRVQCAVFAFSGPICHRCASIRIDFAPAIASRPSDFRRNRGFAAGGSRAPKRRRGAFFYRKHDRHTAAREALQAPLPVCQLDELSKSPGKSWSTWMLGPTPTDLEARPVRRISSASMLPGTAANMPKSSRCLRRRPPGPRLCRLTGERIAALEAVRERKPEAPERRSELPNELRQENGYKIAADIVRQRKSIARYCKL